MVQGINPGLPRQMLHPDLHLLPMPPLVRQALLLSLVQRHPLRTLSQLFLVSQAAKPFLDYQRCRSPWRALTSKCYGGQFKAVSQPHASSLPVICKNGCEYGIFSLTESRFNPLPLSVSPCAYVCDVNAIRRGTVTKQVNGAGKMN